jgi:hypothetical protein
MQGHGIDTTEHRLFTANKAASMALRHTTVRDGGERRSGFAFSPCTRTQRRGLPAALRTTFGVLNPTRKQGSQHGLTIHTFEGKEKGGSGTAFLLSLPPFTNDYCNSCTAIHGRSSLRATTRQRQNFKPEYSRKALGMRVTSYMHSAGERLQLIALSSGP